MAVGPATLPAEFLPVPGFRLGVTCAGIKQPGRRDLVVMELAEGSTTAGVFTLNQFCAAPVRIAKANLQQAPARYWLVNTGNANAGTGAEGLADAQQCCENLGALGGVAPGAVLPFSTGVIGEKLPVEKILAGIPAALAALDENNWEAAANGIMTTDTRPKGASRSVVYQGQRISISGISKGAGMIMPNMATMLAFVATDAQIAATDLQALLSHAAEKSFNRITIDGDTSTNDSCMLAATGASGVAVAPGNPVWALFAEALQSLLLELSHAIVRDGEGATKFVTVAIEQAASKEEALAAAYTIAHSPLIKTALFASDPNWGRILAALGRAGIQHLDVDALQIYLDDICIVDQGGRAAGYTEAQGQAVMNREEITIRVVLNRGAVSEQVWTTDLSLDYVSINADYRS